LVNIEKRTLKSGDRRLIINKIRKDDYEKELTRIATGQKKSNFGGYSQELREKHKERVCYAHEFIG